MNLFDHGSASTVARAALLGAIVLGLMSPACSRFRGKSGGSSSTPDQPVGGGEADSSDPDVRKPSEEPDGPVGFLTYDNARPRCGEFLLDADDASYLFDCRAVAEDEQGNLTTPEAFESGISAAWTARSDGLGAVTCTPATPANASVTCRLVRTSAGALETVHVSLELTRGVDSRTTSDVIRIPVQAVAYGDIDELPLLTPGAPEQLMRQRLIPRDRLLAFPILGLCESGDRLTVASGRRIYVRDEAVGDGFARLAGTYALRPAVGPRPRDTTFDNATRIHCVGGHVYVSAQFSRAIYALASPETISVLATDADQGIGEPTAIVADAKRQVFFIDGSRAVIWTIAPDGTTEILAGGGPTAPSAAPVDRLAAALGDPVSLAVELDGDGSWSRLFVGDAAGGSILSLTRAGSVTRLPGPVSTTGALDPYALAYRRSGPKGQLVVADKGSRRVLTVDLETGAWTEILDDELGFVTAVAPGGDGGLLLASRTREGIYRLSSNGQVSYLAGRVQADVDEIGAGKLADARAILFDGPTSLAVSASGETNAVQVDLAAGSLARGTAVSLTQGKGSTAMAKDADGRLYMVDPKGHRVLRLENGVTTVLVGPATGLVDGLPLAVGSGEVDGTEAYWESGVLPLADGSVLVADTGNHRVLRLDVSQVVTVFAGTGAAGFAGDGGPATAAQFDLPMGLMAGEDGSVYIADHSNSRLRKVDAGGQVSTAYDLTSVALQSGTRAVRPRMVARGPGDALVVDDNRYDVLQLLKDGAGEVVATSLLGVSSALCSSGAATTDGRTSVSTLCIGAIQGLATEDRCAQSTHDFRVAITHAISPASGGSQIVVATMPCPVP